MTYIYILAYSLVQKTPKNTRNHLLVWLFVYVCVCVCVFMKIARVYFLVSKDLSGVVCWYVSKCLRASEFVKVEKCICKRMYRLMYMFVCCHYYFCCFEKLLSCVSV